MAKHLVLTDKMLVGICDEDDGNIESVLEKILSHDERDYTAACH